MGSQIRRTTPQAQSHLVLMQEGEKAECRIIIYRPRGDEQIFRRSCEKFQSNLLNKYLWMRLTYLLLIAKFPKQTYHLKQNASSKELTMIRGFDILALVNHGSSGHLEL